MVDYQRRTFFSSISSAIVAFVTTIVSADYQFSPFVNNLLSSVAACVTATVSTGNSIFNSFNRVLSVDIPHWPIFYIPIRRDPLPSVEVPEISSTTDVQRDGERGPAPDPEGPDSTVQIPEISSTTEIQHDVEEDEDEAEVKGHYGIEDADEDEKDLKDEDEYDTEDKDEYDSEDEEDDVDRELMWFYDKLL